MTYGDIYFYKWHGKLDHDISLFFTFRTGMAGVPGTASSIFETVKDTGANVVMISQVRDAFVLLYGI